MNGVTQEYTRLQSLRQPPSCTSQAESDYWEHIRSLNRTERQHQQPKVICPKCRGTGYTGTKWVGNSSVAVRCDGEAHVQERLDRLSKVSQLLPSETDILLDSIKPYDAPLTDGKCPSCRKQKLDIELIEYQFDHQKGWQCPNCHLIFYGKPSTNKPMLAWARKFVGDANTAPLHGLGYCWGGYGNGKSEVAKAIVNECSRQKRAAIYVNYSFLLNYIRASFKNEADKSMQVKFQKLVDCEVLVVDELDKPTETAWANTLRYDLFDTRYNKALRGGKFTTLVFSNKPRDQVLDGALFSRYSQDERNGRIVCNTAPDVRAIMGYE